MALGGTPRIRELHPARGAGTDAFQSSPSGPLADKLANPVALPICFLAAADSSFLEH